MKIKNMTGTQFMGHAQKLYEESGQSKVYDFFNEVEKNQPDIGEWLVCEPCETETPHVKDKDGDMCCAVCGTYIVNRKEIK